MSDKRVDVGLGFFQILILMFIFLKLVGVINWSWFLIISPMLVPLFFFSLMLIAVLVAKKI
jgi:hypothetical protein